MFSKHVRSSILPARADTCTHFKCATVRSVAPTDPNVVQTSHNTQMNIKTTELLKLGATAAEAYDECETALAELNAAFGAPYEAAKDNLLRDITLAESQGLDLSIFAGTDSRLKFPSYNTNIIVRVHRVPTEHERLKKLSEKIEKLEKVLKLAKMQLKHTAQQLVIVGQCDELTNKITLAFARLRK